jgi:hypothetical protein
MALPELNDPSIKADALEKASAIRDQFLENIMGKVNHPQAFPQLTDEQKQKVLDKITYLLQNEPRPRFWLALVEQLEPNFRNDKEMIRPMVLKWAGVIKIKKPSEGDGQQTIGNAKNGRVIRSSKGL